MADDLDPAAVERAWAEYIGGRVDAEAARTGARWTGRIVERTRRQERRRSFEAGYRAALAAAGPLVTPEHDAQVAARALRDEAARLHEMARSDGPGNVTTGYGRAGLDIINQIVNRADCIAREVTS